MAKNNHQNIELDNIFSEQFASAEESLDGKLDNYKTIESYDVDNFEILTDTGFKPLSSVSYNST